MATKKNAAAQQQPKLLDECLFSEIDGLVKTAAKLIVREDESSIEIPADKIGLAIDVLSLTRLLAKKVDQESKETLAKIMEPVAERVAKVNSEKKSIIGRAQEIEADVVFGLKELVKDGVLTADGAQSKSGCKITLIGSDTVVLDDASAVPDEYLLPREQCIDMSKIRAVLAAEQAYANALPAGTVAPASNVPFAHLEKSYTFRTKVPEEVA
jgi:hypothetical protein